jgi:AraC-like DNA-binding protein
MRRGGSVITKESIKDLCDMSRVLIRDTDFVYLLPHPSLNNWISNYTITFPSEGMMSDKYAVIPHGCATLVLSFDGTKIFGNLFGPATKPISVGSEANCFSLLFIVEFQPAGYYAFSGMPQSELTDTVIAFETVNPALNRLMAQQMETATDIHSLVTEIDRLFLAHLKAAFYRAEFSLANQMIVKSGGAISVKELSQNVFYSERHLGRIFGEYIGVNIKSFSRLVRVNKAIRLLRRPHFSITQAYLQTGYYDMPHFIHDFKSICGITRQEYRDNLSDFYSEIAKF